MFFFFFPVLRKLCVCVCWAAAMHSTAAAISRGTFSRDVRFFTSIFTSSIIIIVIRTFT